MLGYEIDLNEDLFLITDVMHSIFIPMWLSKCNIR